MSRERVNITVDSGLLEAVRSLRPGVKEADLVDMAFRSLRAERRAAEVDPDAECVGYDRVPLSEPDAWGDLESFRRAAAAS